MKDEVFKSITVNIPETNKKRIVIIGGGFAGIQFTRRINSDYYQVVMLDRNNYHNFQPLLYQVATAGLEPDSIAGPLRPLFSNKPDFHFRMARVTHINPRERTVKTMVGDLHFDILILANGSRTNFYDNKKFLTGSFPLKQIPHALDLRSHLLQNFERAVMTTSPDDQVRIMNTVIVGGGPTGVELAGALAELKAHVLPNDFPDLDLKRMNIYLIEGGDRLLGGMSENAGTRALNYLKKFGVHVFLSVLVNDYEKEKVFLSNGEVIATQTMIWAAGVKGNLIDGFAGASIKDSRLLVDQYCLVRGYDSIYAVGDIALMESTAHPRGHPMLAPVAIQQGKRLARNLNLQAKDKPMKPFRYRAKGVMATVGRNKAVVDLSAKVSVGGFVAWVVWMFVHLVSIIGFRSKLVILSNWVWSYLTYDRGARLIIRLFLNEKKEREKYGTY